MVQLSNENTPQNVVLKIEGYSSTSRSERLTLKFTNQYTGKVVSFERLMPTVTNGRYQEMSITPPAGADRMSEGLYILEVYNEALTTLYATRLAFIRSALRFGEATYTSYTEGDDDAYNVYHRK